MPSSSLVGAVFGTYDVQILSPLRLPFRHPGVETSDIIPCGGKTLKTELSR